MVDYEWMVLDFYQFLMVFLFEWFVEKDCNDEFDEEEWEDKVSKIKNWKLRYQVLE